ncbi:hypothetical protein CCM_00564 [Cordyceps militaris CM01]|uniref:Uncharacterized protein n=1 Tax=Cordyceps militaris (strain CM01) TaxID=983644 RepID=G3J4U3_CORMM|nr:uncharacterized protein CCM_00564 [Cordyceps militaris CM01]EGX95910.1 hypothetical protein CCM_00564 [Cordyceps militaris CM01]
MGKWIHLLAPLVHVPLMRGSHSHTHWRGFGSRFRSPASVIDDRPLERAQTSYLSQARDGAI